jgi:EEF1A N-terminal glycine/lysine methyltransferase
MSSDGEENDPIEIFATSLESLYDHQAVTVASAGSNFMYSPKCHPRAQEEALIELITPDTKPENWFLHASDIWVSARYLADHLHLLQLENVLTSACHTKQLRLLELGASAGLPGILIAKLYPEINVTSSDYPDELLINTLRKNIKTNGVESNCKAIPHVWGSDPNILLENAPNGFDMIIAADTLWNSEMHPLFIRTLEGTLKKSPKARVHLVAGLHTGRYTISSFLKAVGHSKLEVEVAKEYRTNRDIFRHWSPDSQHDDDASERRKFTIWVVLKWRTDTGTEK